MLNILFPPQISLTDLKQCMVIALRQDILIIKNLNNSEKSAWVNTKTENEHREVKLF